MGIRQEKEEKQVGPLVQRTAEDHPDPALSSHSVSRAGGRHGRAGASAVERVFKKQEWNQRAGERSLKGEREASLGSRVFAH